MRLSSLKFAAVYSSPRQRAVRTAELAGFVAPIVTPLLEEFDYGDYEGLTSRQVHEDRPDWELFRDGCPNGESPEQVYRRALTFIQEALGHEGLVLAFAHGHVLRMVAVAFLALPAVTGALLSLDVATISILRNGERGHLLQRWNSV